MRFKKKPENYVSNEELLKEIIKSKANFATGKYKNKTECITDKLTIMLNLLVEGISQKHNWRNYTYIEEMRGDARLALCQNALKFDETKWFNPYGYYTKVIWSSFISYLDKEKKIAKTKNSLLEEYEMLPSFSRQTENEEDQREENIKSYEKDEIENPIKEQMDKIQNLIKNFKIEYGMNNIIKELSEIFYEDINYDIFTNISTSMKLFPKDTKIDILVGNDIRSQYGSDVLSVQYGKTKVIKGIKDKSVWGSNDQNGDICSKLIIILLHIEKERIMKLHGITHDFDLKYKG